MLSATEISPSIPHLLQGLEHNPAWQNLYHWQCGLLRCQVIFLSLQKFLRFWSGVPSQVEREASILVFPLLNRSLNEPLPEPVAVMKLPWRLMPESHNRPFSESTDPVIEGSRMYSVFLIPLIFGEATGSAIHNQLVLLISRDSGIVAGHFSIPPYM